jgi:phosphatidylglycerophosphate synthase
MTSTALAAFTTARLLLVPMMIATFAVDQVLFTAALCAFMAADLFDGILARRLDADGPDRRALDSIVDRLAIDACLVAACIQGSLEPALLAGFLARDLVLGAVCASLMHQRRVAIKADIVYRGLGFSFAVWAVAAPLLSSGARTALATAILVGALGVAGDLIRSAVYILRSDESVRDRVIPAGAVRHAASRNVRRRGVRRTLPATA